MALRSCCWWSSTLTGRSPLPAVGALAAALALGATTSWLVTGTWVGVAAAGGLVAVLALATLLRLRDFRCGGALLWSTYLAVVVLGLVWVLWFALTSR